MPFLKTITPYLMALSAIAFYFGLAQGLKDLKYPRGSYIPASVIRTEFKSISPPEGVIFTKRSEGYKSFSGMYFEQYKLSVSFDEILAHYEAELESNGWQFLYVKYGYGYVFCKGKIRASLLFREAEKNYDFSVSFNSDSTSSGCIKK